MELNGLNCGVVSADDVQSSTVRCYCDVPHSRQSGEVANWSDVPSRGCAVTFVPIALPAQPCRQAASLTYTTSHIGL
jgi:predicted AlkP superfamily phosphohydrolase/phosphomutase